MIPWQNRLISRKVKIWESHALTVSWSFNSDEIVCEDLPIGEWTKNKALWS